MASKIKLAVNWAGACGGCDVALLDIEEKILDLAAVADVVYWPVGFDFKRPDLAAFGPGEIDVGIFNGVVRTSEQEEDARILRQRCKVLVAFGACAAFGGIPGLANLYDRDEMLDRVYDETESTDNPEGIRPQASTDVAGHALELPRLHTTVRSLPQVVEVDYIVPGCPPPVERVLDAFNLIAEYARGGELPPRGAWLADDKALCDSCPRVETKTGRRMAPVRRPHQIEADPGLCFLEQGLVCAGIATRGGCGATCINANMPCRGCFGPTPLALDPAAEALSTIGSIAASEHEDDLTPGKRLTPVRAILDPAGTFYRFTLPSATVFRRVDDTPEGGKE